MSDGAKAAGTAVIAILLVLVSASDYPSLDAVPVVYYAALVLALVAIVAGLSKKFPKVDISGAARPAAVGALAFAILGIVSSELVKTPKGEPDQTWLSIGLIVIGLVGVLLMYSGTSMPAFSWSKLPIVATLAAILLIGAFGITIVFMLVNASAKATDEVVWGRYLVVFTAIQGVALAAVGALLGTQVKEGEVQDTKKLGLEIVEAAETLKNATPTPGKPTPDAPAVAAAEETIRLGKARLLR